MYWCRVPKNERVCYSGVPPGGMVCIHPPNSAKLQPLSGPLSPADAAYMRQVPYREAVGAIWYIVRATRFDIFRATQEVAKFVANPGPVHWQAVQRLLLYLQRTADKPMVYKPASFTDRALRGEGLDACLVANSDSDWAGDKTTSKSRTGWLVHWGGCLVAWRSVVQKSVAQSSCKAEYIAGAAVANEVVWWRRLCAELGYPMHGATPIRCDNDAAYNLAKHSGNFEATKHFLLKYHVLRPPVPEGGHHENDLVSDCEPTRRHLDQKRDRQNIPAYRFHCSRLHYLINIAFRHAWIEHCYTHVQFLSITICSRT